MLGRLAYYDASELNLEVRVVGQEFTVTGKIFPKRSVRPRVKAFLVYVANVEHLTSTTRRL